MEARVQAPAPVCDVCAEIDRTVSCPVVYCSDIIEHTRTASKSERKPVILEFLSFMNALLNEGGGLVCIHTSNAYGLWCFDEQVDGKLNLLIPDGSLFHENFERYFWDKKHVLFRVTHRKRPLSTLAVNSKVALDVGLQDMTQIQIQHWLQVDTSTVASKDRMRDCIPKFEKDQTVEISRGVFQENTSVQAKRVPGHVLGVQMDLHERIKSLIQYIWEEKSLPAYVSAFTKLPRGGVIYFGVYEEKVEEIRTGKFICEGISLTAADRNDVRITLQKKIESEITWLSKSSHSPEHPVRINFHRVSAGNVANTGLFVLEVAVKKFDGICFYDSKGPLSYGFSSERSTTLEALSVGEWLERYSVQRDGLHAVTPMFPPSQ